MKGRHFSLKKPSCYRSAGACPPRTFGSPQHGEGQALALREGETFFSLHRGAYRRDVERFMKHPHLIKDLTNPKRGQVNRRLLILEFLIQTMENPAVQ